MGVPDKVKLSGATGSRHRLRCKWVSVFRPADRVSAPQADLARENERLRLENRVLKEERDILKKATRFFASQRP